MLFLDAKKYIKSKPVSMLTPDFFKTTKKTKSEENTSPSENLTVTCESAAAHKGQEAVANNMKANSGDSPTESQCPPTVFAPAKKLAYALADTDEGYSMDKVPKGICLILSNEKFDEQSDQDDRKGAKADVENIRKTFDQLGFTVRIHEDARVVESNSNTPDLLSIFSNCAKENHTKYSCFVAFILSHGCEDGVYGIDGRTMDMNHILNPFKDCKSLSGKPKLFFGQFCQGEKEERVAVDGPEPGRTFLTKMHPKEADFYIGYATPPGMSYVSSSILH